MRTVSIDDRPSQLAEHLRLPANGEEFLVCDQGKPIARIVPIAEHDDSAQTRDLIARGILTPPRGERVPMELWPPLVGNRISNEVMNQVWREERGEY
jgi:antitoxin (DNA-binding transcriptional repressor) of toxin-antitoxin stability system